MSKLKVLVDLVSFVCDRYGIMFPSSCCPFTWQEEGERVLRGVFYKGTDLTNEGSTLHDLITFQSTHLLIPSHWRPYFNLWIWEEHIQTIAIMLLHWKNRVVLPFFFFLVLVLGWHKRSKLEYLRILPDISTNITENLLGARHLLGIGNKVVDLVIQMIKYLFLIYIWFSFIFPGVQLSKEFPKL